MEKEVRFTEKKVDESWKEEVSRQKGERAPSQGESQTGLSFSAFLSSLGYQCLMQLGEMPHPETREKYLDLEAAKETIDLVILLKTKTEGNRTAQEDQLIKSLLTELQMKFVEKTKAEG